MKKVCLIFAVAAICFSVNTSARTNRTTTGNTNRQNTMGNNNSGNNNMNGTNEYNNQNGTNLGTGRSTRGTHRHMRSHHYRSGVNRTSDGMNNAGSTNNR